MRQQQFCFLNLRVAMSRLPTMTKSNLPREPNIWDGLHRKVESEMTGFDEAMRVVEQSRTYDGGQIDMFPEELIEISSLFYSKVEANDIH